MGRVSLLMGNANAKRPLQWERGRALTLVIGGLALVLLVGLCVFYNIPPKHQFLKPGDNLRMALVRAPEGGVIHLAEGEYVIDSYLHIDKPLTLKGAGKDRTRILVTAPDTQEKVRFLTQSARFPIIIEDISWEYQGTAEGPLLCVSGFEEVGSVEVRRCRFTGAKGKKTGSGGGIALFVFSIDSLKVEDCEFENNQGIALCVFDAELKVQHTIFQHNGAGMMAHSKTKSIVVDRCEFKNHREWGAWITGEDKNSLIRECTFSKNNYSLLIEGSFVIEKNIIEDSSSYGLWISDLGRQGEVRNNQFVRNQCGINASVFTPNSVLVIENNLLSENKEGISIWGKDTSQVEVRDNIVRNCLVGIDVRFVNAVVEGNCCEGNRVGISTGGYNQSKFIQNTLRNNEVGLLITPWTNPIVQGNRFSGNKQDVARRDWRVGEFGEGF